MGTDGQTDGRTDGRRTDGQTDRAKTIYPPITIWGHKMKLRGREGGREKGRQGREEDYRTCIKYTIDDPVIG